MIYAFIGFSLACNLILAICTGYLMAMTRRQDQINRETKLLVATIVDILEKTHLGSLKRYGSEVIH